ncbi:MAG: tyrosine--tRNA ligase, partial [Patescibacteria group bacterium]
DELKERGLIYQVSNEEAVKKYFDKKGYFYAGFDPSAASLTIGNLLIITLMKRLEKAGLKPIALVGGATGMVGDPSGKSQERVLRSEKDVKESTAAIKKQLANFFDVSSKGGSASGGKKIKFVNNLDWFSKISLIEFLRDIGKRFSVNEMLAKEAVKNRLEAGISYTEFSYMILQAYDFLNLHKKFDCRLQVGGSDQWGNITAGIELVRKNSSEEVYGFTAPLITTSDGVKIGKSDLGTIWLNSKLTSPYAFYQFWMNIDDKDAVKFLKYFTFLPLEKIKEIEKEFSKAPQNREAQKTLAKEITTFVHGENAYKRAQKISEVLFYGDVKKLNQKELEEVLLNTEVVKLEKFDSLNVVDLLVLAKVVDSKRQAREDILNRAIEINGEKTISASFAINKKNLLFGRYLVIKRGKKDYRFVVVK